MSHMQERIEKYKYGALCTNKGTLYTSNIEYGFLREVCPNHYPERTKNNFGIINENHSYCPTDYTEK